MPADALNACNATPYSVSRLRKELGSFLAREAAVGPIAQGIEIDELADFMARAYQMEQQAAQRYAWFAEHLEARANHPVAKLFRELAELEALHARRILDEMGWSNAPAPSTRFDWPDDEGPETLAMPTLQSLQRPYHALEAVLRSEQRAQRYFEAIASSATEPGIRRAAAEMAAEERDHARRIHSWLARVPRPLSWD